MKIGILETGRPPEPLVPEFGTYSDMFVRMLQDAGLEPETEVYDVQAGLFPSAPEAHDAYLVTGGAAVGRLTGRSMLRSGLRQLALGGVAVAVTFSVGHLIGHAA